MVLGNPLVRNYHIMAQYETIDTDCSLKLHPKPPKAQLPKPYPAASTHLHFVSLKPQCNRPTGNNPLIPGFKPKQPTGKYVCIYTEPSRTWKGRNEGNPCPNFQKSKEHRKTNCKPNWTKLSLTWSSLLIAMTQILNNGNGANWPKLQAYDLVKRKARRQTNDKIQTTQQKVWQ